MVATNRGWALFNEDVPDTEHRTTGCRAWKGSARNIKAMAEADRFPAGSGPSIARIRSGTALEEMTPVWRVRSRRAGDAYPVGAVRGAGASRAAGAFNPTRPGSFRQCGETQARNKLVYTVAATVPLSCVSAGMFVPCRPVVVAQEHARGSGTAANLLALSPTLNPQPSQNPE
jgi:hypothetical protein